MPWSIVRRARNGLPRSVMCSALALPFGRLMIIGTLLAAGLAPPAQAQVDSFQSQVPAAEVRQLDKARMLRKLKRPADAVAVLKPLVVRQPEYFNAHYELGLALSDVIEEIEKSVSALEKAAALKRTHPEVTDAHVFNTLGWVYMYTGNTQRAEALFKEAEAHMQQLSPDVQRRLHNNLGTLYLNTGRRTEAAKYLQTAADRYGSTQATQSLKSLDEIKRRDSERARK